MDDDRGDRPAPSHEAPSRYGDALVRAGEAFWALWPTDAGEPRAARFHSWAEAEAARENAQDDLPCLRYTWCGS